MRLGRGATRTVVLVGRWAVKLPGTWTAHPRYWWRGMLLGLLANQQETEFAATGWPELCPVLASLPGGWLVVMPRLRVLTAEEFARLPWGRLSRGRDAGGEYEVPVEAKPDSFGVYRDRVVALDYGGGGYGGRARRPYLCGEE